LLNAIRVNTTLGGSTNCPPHLLAIARHAGVALTIRDWEDTGYRLPLLVNRQPAGEYLGEDFHRAGGTPAVMRQLWEHGLLDGDPLTVTGRSIAEQLQAAPRPDATITEEPRQSVNRHRRAIAVAADPEVRWHSDHQKIVRCRGSIAAGDSVHV